MTAPMTPAEKAAVTRLWTKRVREQRHKWFTVVERPSPAAGSICQGHCDPATAVASLNCAEFFAWCSKYDIFVKYEYGTGRGTRSSRWYWVIPKDETQAALIRLKWLGRGAMPEGLGAL